LRDSLVLHSLVTLIISLYSSSDYYLPPPALHSFPTRRSSDLLRQRWPACLPHRSVCRSAAGGPPPRPRGRAATRARRWQSDGTQDRKSTRLNSSHQIISYAVFCLKKKKKNKIYAHNIKKTYNT